MIPTHPHSHPLRATYAHLPRVVWWLVPALVLCAVLLGLPASVPAQTDADLIRHWKGEWSRTDFSKAAVSLASIISGGPPRDGIPPIDKPRFVSVTEAAAWLEAGEPVLLVREGRDARAYPLQILIWHEIVNDTVGGRPVTVTFCPLCNSALVFDRRLPDDSDGRVLDFGTTGKLRKSDLVMWDRQTESWWQQLTGEAIVGELTGARLTFIPAPLVAFATFRESFPRGRVLSRETGHQRPYGENPYAGYDSPTNTQPFLLRERADPRLRTMERVVVLEAGGEAMAWPYTELAKVGVVDDTVGGVPVVVIYGAGVRSALDSSTIRESREVGTGVVFRRTLDGRALAFEAREGRIFDKETGSRWDLLGRAVSGPLQGKRLEAIPHGNHFAFAWLAFRPDTGIWRAP